MRASLDPYRRAEGEKRAFRLRVHLAEVRSQSMLGEADPITLRACMCWVPACGSASWVRGCLERGNPELQDPAEKLGPQGEVRDCFERFGRVDVGHRLELSNFVAELSCPELRLRGHPDTLLGVSPVWVVRVRVS